MENQNKIQFPIPPKVQHLNNGFDLWDWSIELTENCNSIDKELIVSALFYKDVDVNVELGKDRVITMDVCLLSNINYPVAYDLNIRALILLENTIGSFEKIQGTPRIQWKAPFFSADRNGALNNDKTQLMLSSAKGDINSIQFILDSETDPNINTKSPIGSTALMYAALYGHLNIVELLIAHGADVKVGSGEGVPIQAAVSGGLEITKLFLDLGAEVNATNRYGENALMSVVCKYGSQQETIAKLLLKHGADPNIKNMMGLSALDLAIRNGKKELVDLLRRAENK